MAGLRDPGDSLTRVPLRIALNAQGAIRLIVVILHRPREAGRMTGCLGIHHNRLIGIELFWSAEARSALCQPSIQLE